MYLAQATSSPSTAPSSQLPPAADGLVGVRLDGRFLLLERIGAGGMGQVYKAMQLPMERLVAVKVLSPALEAKATSFEARFLREAAVTAQLKHPNTVSVIDYGVTSDGVYFIAMELLEGRTLGRELKAGGPMPWRRAVAITLQVCRSVREAHRIGMVHRDLKPANVMLLDQESDHDAVKVLDFGLAKSFIGDDEVDMTQSGVFVGSPTFMAPEQARGEASPQSDIYSIGVLLFHMLAGRPPFESKNSIDVIVQHLQAPVPSVRDVHPAAGVPDELEELVHRCLGKVPEARPASLDELMEALRRCVEPTFATEVTPRPPSRTPLGSPSPWATPVPPGLRPIGAPRPRPSPAVVSGSRARPSARRRGWRVVIGVGVAALAALGLGAVASWSLLTSPATPSVAPVAPTHEPPAVGPRPTLAPVAKPAEGERGARSGVVRFRLESTPSGAKVWFKGRRVGTTPFVLDVPEAGEGAPTTLQASLRLDGYQPQEVSAGGYGPEVVLRQKLARVGDAPALAPPNPPRRPPPEPLALAPASVIEPGAPSLGNPTRALALPEPAVGQLERELVDRAAARTLPEDAQPPEPLDGNQPAKMPESALSAATDATVVVRFVVDVDGSVKNVQLLRGDEPFVAAALAAVKTWRYEPARLDGRPLAVYRVQKVQFRTRLPSESKGTPSFSQ